MQSKLFKKGLVVGIITLFIGIGIQPAFAIENNSSDLNENPSITDGLPDLIIKSISFYEHDPGSRFYYIYCDVMNQGDDYAYGDLTMEFKVIKTFFWLFNLGTIYEESFTIDLRNGLEPGGKKYVLFYADDTGLLPPFCFARFIVKVNTDKKIIESNYDNNKDMLKVYSAWYGWSKVCPWLPW